MMIPHVRAIRRPNDEDGFGMIEIVVSMFLLALIALAFVPVLVQSTRLSVVNASIATAAQLVSQNMEQARAQGTSCSKLTEFAKEPLSPVVDKRLVSFQPVRKLEGCPISQAASPATVTFTVTVTETGSSVVLARAVTLILVRWVP